MNTSTSLVPLFSTKEGQPFIFWDPESWRLLLCHGKFITIVYYDKMDALSCPVKLTVLSSRKQEQYLYCNGRIVASYLPKLNTIAIKRDGEIFTFDAPERPFCYTVISPIDTRSIISHSSSANQSWQQLLPVFHQIYAHRTTGAV